MIIFKNAVLHVLLLLFISATTLSVNAGGILKVKPVEKSGKAVVRITNFDSECVKLSIEDADQNLVYYSKKLDSGSDFAKVFDLSLLEDGHYLFVVKAGDEVLKEEIKIVNSKLSLKDKKKFEKPIIKLKDDLLLVYLNNASNKYYNINFFDDSGKIFEDNIVDLTKVRQYSLVELPYGEYTITVSSESGTYRETFVKED